MLSLLASSTLAKAHPDSAFARQDPPPPPPLPRSLDAAADASLPAADASAAQPPHTHMQLQGRVQGHCPTSLTGLGPGDACEQQCETDDDCVSEEEICCTVGCSSACAMAILPPRLPSKAVAIAAMITCAWMLVCSMLNGARQRGGY